MFPGALSVFPRPNTAPNTSLIVEGVNGIMAEEGLPLEVSSMYTASVSFGLSKWILTIGDRVSGVHLFSFHRLPQCE